MLILKDRLLIEDNRLMKETGKWLDEEGSVHLYSYDLTDTTGVIIQLHADASLNPLY